jgi:hypothetical protein
MQHRTFDRLTRTLAAQPTRRGFLGGLGALVAAGFATTALGQRRDFDAKLADAADDPEEQTVLLFEEIGRITHEHDGTCEELSEKVRRFRDSHIEQLERIRAEEATWTKDHRIQHANTYGDRRDVVVDRVNAGLEQCKTVAGGAASPMAATPAALLPSADLAARVPTRTDRTTVHTWAQDTVGCSPDSYNFMLEANCVRGDSDWKGPDIQWPGLCESWTIDDGCELCSENVPGELTGPEFCAKWWPQDCVRSGENACHVEYHGTHGGIAAAICEDEGIKDKVFSDTVRCYSRESDWASREFTWNVYCPHGHIDKDCINCQTGFDALEGAEACVKYWPDQCHAKSGKNNCYIGYHVTCCEESCPITSGDCSFNIIDSILGNARCAACETAWCGSYSRCLTNCDNMDCCTDECSSHNVIPHVPPGGLVKPGTPVPLGTPDVATPVGTPINPPPLPPGTPGTEVPPPLPPGTPATEIPTETPTQAPTEPPGTPIASPAS